MCCAGGEIHTVFWIAPKERFFTFSLCFLLLNVRRVLFVFLDCIRWRRNNQTDPLFAFFIEIKTKEIAFFSMAVWFFFSRFPIQIGFLCFLLLFIVFLVFFFPAYVHSTDFFVSVVHVCNYFSSFQHSVAVAIVFTCMYDNISYCFFQFTRWVCVWCVCLWRCGSNAFFQITIWKEKLRDRNFEWE